MTNTIHADCLLNKKLPFAIFTCDGADFLGHHWHKEVEILYVQKGVLKLGVNNEMVQLNEGDFYLIKNGDIHFGLSSPGSSRLVIQFDLALFGDFQFIESSAIALVEVFASIYQSSTFWEPDLRERLICIFNELEREFNNKELGFELAIKSLLFEMAFLICRRAPKSTKESSFSLNKKSDALKLRKIFNYIEDNYMNTITLQDAAIFIGFTSTYFSRFFKKYTGFTFCNYVNQYRILKAQRYLLNEDMSITEIALTVGFPNVKTFNRLFKEEMGSSPTQFKKTIFEKF